MTSLAIIPARGGSKRIPRKNIRYFCGKPIIAYSIKAAQDAGCFDEIMVSTDDEEIAEISKYYGASVPFFRSPETSNDHAGILEVLEEVVESYRSSFEKNYDTICCILPTAPFIQINDILKAKSIFENKGFDSTFPLVKFSYPILRSLKIEDGKVSMNWPEYYQERSQDLPDSFHDAGQFYWINAPTCFAKKSVFTENIGGIEISELYAQDIDTDEDWKIAEIKFKLQITDQ